MAGAPEPFPDIVDRKSLSSVGGTSILYRDSSCDDEEANHDSYLIERTRRTRLGRLLRKLGIDVAARPSRSSSADEDWQLAYSPSGYLRSKAPQSPRRRRRPTVCSVTRRAAIVIPLVILTAFGLLHLVHVIQGRTPLFGSNKDEEPSYDFLPNWGQPGQPGAGLVHYPTDATRDIIPIACHSHNDYWRRIPLFSAIHHGCTGVEADVWWFEDNSDDDELYVGHSIAALTRNRTFRALYVNPLIDLLEHMNANASTTLKGVFDVDPAQSLVLLIDFKTDAHATWAAVDRQLQPLRERDALSFFDGTKLQRRAVTVVATGNAPFDLVKQSRPTHRDIFYDAPIALFGSSSPEPINERLPYSTENSYYASTSFLQNVGFTLTGRLSAHQLDTVRRQIRGAHARGLTVRYWDTPTWPASRRNAVWQTLWEEGADMINADDLDAAARQDWRSGRGPRLES